MKQFLLLLSLAGMLLYLVVTDQLLLFIHPSFNVLVYVTLVALGLLLPFTSKKKVSTTSCCILILPLLALSLFPPAATVPTTFEVNMPTQSVTKTVVVPENIEVQPEEFRTLTDPIFESPESYVGSTISISGYIGKAPGLEHDEYVLGRLLVWHCVADAYPAGVLLRTEQELIESQWYAIEGVLTTIEKEGATLPIIEVHIVEAIEEPDVPYFY